MADTTRFADPCIVEVMDYLERLDAAEEEINGLRRKSMRMLNYLLGLEDGPPAPVLPLRPRKLGQP